MTVVGFSYNGRSMKAQEGITVAEALRANGIRLGHRSMRLRAWRDEYHPLKEVPSAWVSIDGIANINAYRVMLKGGMHIRSQGKRSLLSYIGRYSGTGFYYRNFTRSEFARNFFFERVKGVNDYGGPLDPEDAAQATMQELSFSPSKELHTDVLIVGAGVSGLAALLSLNLPAGKSVVVVDANSRDVTEGNFRQMLMDLSQQELLPLRNCLPEIRSLTELLASRNAVLLDGTTVFGAFNGGEFAAVQGYSRVVLLKPALTILSHGCEEVKPVFRRNDLPGVVTSRSLLAMPEGLRARRKLPVLYLETPLSVNYLARVAEVARPIMLFTGFHADAEYSSALRSVFGIAKEDIEEAVPAGAAGVMNLETVSMRREDGSIITMASDLLVVAGRLQPRCEIGALLSLPTRISSETHMPVPAVDEGMRCAGNIFACGSLVFPFRIQGIVSAVIAANSISLSNGAQIRPDLEKMCRSLIRHSVSVQRLPSPPADGKSVICPCLDVTLGDVGRLYGEGYDTINRMRRFSGLFMGPCQGARCYRNTYEAFTAVAGKEADFATVRPPLVPVYLGALALTDVEFEEGEK